MGVLLLHTIWGKLYDALTYLTWPWFSFAGRFLGNIGFDVSVLYFDQQKGLWVIQSLKEQMSGSPPQHQSQGVHRGGSVFCMLCPLSLHPGTLHPDANRQHGGSLPGTERYLPRQKGHAVAFGHKRESGSSHLCVPVRYVQETTGGRAVPQVLPQWWHRDSHGNVLSDGDVADGPS